MCRLLHVRGKFGEGLAPAAAQSQQKGVSQRLAKNAGDAAHVLDGVHKEN